MEQLNEELLSAWLRLSSTIDNQRLVRGMSFNEALVCNLMVHARRQGRTLTARDLCQDSGILFHRLGKFGTNDSHIARRSISIDQGHALTLTCQTRCDGIVLPSGHPAGRLAGRRVRIRVPRAIVARRKHQRTKCQNEAQKQCRQATRPFHLILHKLE